MSDNRLYNEITYSAIKTLGKVDNGQPWGNCNSNCNVIVMNYIFKVMEGNL